MGRVHSIETGSAVDGPGLRTVVFLQGCPLRCKFCHNPDTWDFSGGQERSAEEIAQCELAVAAPDSLQRETGDGLTLEGMLGGESPEDGLIERIALREAIDELPEREKMTILLRFFKGLTQEQAARLLGVSQVQVSRLERRALEKLRASLSDGL